MMEEKSDRNTVFINRRTNRLYLPLAALAISAVLVTAWILIPHDNDDERVESSPFEYLQTELKGSIEMEAVRDLAATHSLDIGDLDGDGIKEVVTAGVMANETTTAVEGDLRVWSFNPETNENVSLAAVVWPLFSGPTLSCMAIADVDNDGTNEIVVVAHNKPSFINSVISIWNYSSGSLNKEAEIDALWGTILMALSISDVDDDNQLEIIAAGYRESTTYRRGYVGIWNYSSNGAFIVRETYRIWTDDDRTRLFSVVAGDIDEDLRIEIIVTGSGWDEVNETPTSEVVVFNLEDDWLYVKQLIVWEGRGAKSSQLIDFDGDNRPELVVADTRQVDFRLKEYLTIWKFSNESQEMELCGNGSYGNATLHVFLEQFSTTCESPQCDNTIFTVGFIGDGGTNWALLHVWQFNMSNGTAYIVQHNSWGWGFGDWTGVYDAILADIDMDGDPEIITAGTARGSGAFQVRIWDG